MIKKLGLTLLFVGVIGLCLVGCKKDNVSTSEGDSNQTDIQTGDDTTQTDVQTGDDADQTDTQNKEESVRNGVSMTLVSYENGVLNIKITNNSEETINYGEDIELQMEQNGEYAVVEPKEAFAWIDEVYDLEPGAEVEKAVDLSPYGELAKGNYRLIKFPEMILDFAIE